MKRIKTGKIDKRYLKRLEIIVLCPCCNKDFIDKEWRSWVTCPYCKARLIAKICKIKGDKNAI